MNNRPVVYFTAALCLFATGLFAQANTGLKANIAAINAMRKKLPVEKLYMQTDKPYYTLGDTLHFKAYLLDADFLTPSQRSGLLYVELDDVAGKSVKRILVPVALGLAWSDIALDEKTITPGSYTLRAYTNWMRNFGNNYVFKKSIYISAINDATLITSAFKIDSIAGQYKVKANLNFTSFNKDALRFKNINIKIINGNSTLLRDKAATGMDGSLSTEFNITDKKTIKDLAIKAQFAGKGADTTTLTIPITLNRPEKTDLQFMPEGGNLVAGIKTKVGFKAIGEDGKGLMLNGRVYNSKQQEVAAFKSQHLGMGSFEFSPAANETYTALAVLPGGSIIKYKLPPVKLNGTALAIKPLENDSLQFTVAATAGITGAYYLIGQARGVVCYAQSINFSKGRTVKQTIASALFPTGIARFSLFNADNLPLNERQVFIDHNDALQISINAARQNYNTRDSIALAVEVKDKDGKPVQGSFSMAVTDDDQVKADSLGNNLLYNLLLTSDVKGDIEEPGYYFQSKNKAADLDNLLLTQGWVGYNWKDVFNPAITTPAYNAEAEYLLQGRVTNVFNKPVEKSEVVLYANKPVLLRDTLTDKDGIFTFKGLAPVDTAIYKLTSHNKKGKNNNVGIDIINPFIAPVFAASNDLPWYVNSDTTLLSNTQTKAAQQKAEANFRGEGQQLKQVNITSKKTIKNSRHIIEPNPTDQVLDEQDMLKAGKQTLSDILATKIKGFQLRTYGTSYLVNGNMIYFVVDGISLNQLFSGSDKEDMLRAGNPLGPTKDPARYNFLKGYMDSFSAEDIIGIEVMQGAAAAGAYTSRYIPFIITSLGESKPTMGPLPLVFVEITTRAGKGPFNKPTPGTYLYKPLPFTLARQFYSPKYTAANKNMGIGTDLRSTIYWQHSIVTNADGEAQVSFYSADKPARYSIQIEGTDLQGQIGYKKQKLTITKGPAN